jgi:hypothetical protein
MRVLHIDSEKDVEEVDKLIKKGNDVFILVYMVGCGPCNATRPEWSKIEPTLKEQYSQNDNLVIIDINKDFISKIRYIGPIDGFPTMKYIGNNGKIVETYENSSVKKKDRSITSFINWIETKINDVISTTPSSSSQHVYNRLVKTGKHKQTKTHNKKTHNKRAHNKKTHNKYSHKGGKKIKTRKHKKICKYCHK